MTDPSDVRAARETGRVADRTTPRAAASLARYARAAWRREPGLAGVGLAGLVIASLCMIAVAVRGPFIPPEGKMLDATTFTFGVGVFTLTVALLLPMAAYSERAERRWRRSYYIFAVYGLALEPIQSFRGLDPRFSDAGGPADVIAGAFFGLTAGVMTIVCVLLGLRFFRADVIPDRPVLRLGIRYGFAAVMVSFGVGIIMSITSGRVIGEDGNLLLAHGLGVHGIQALPIMALLLLHHESTENARLWSHVVGLGWLTACAAALAQAALGRPPFEPSILSGLVVTGLATWAAAGAYVLLKTRQLDPQPDDRSAH
jgi:hypothetical protein